MSDRAQRRRLARRCVVTAVLAALIAIGVGVMPSGDPRPADTSASEWPGPIRDQTDRMRLGTAVAGAETNTSLQDPAYRTILRTHFDTLTPENQMKWSVIHPEPARYDFTGADELAGFARANGQTLRGHTLLWYGSLPDWAAGLEGRSCQDVRGTLRDHIHTVVARYRGVVTEWDVANEVMNGDGRLRIGGNPFVAACGESIIRDAFMWAREADPDAALYINDFDIEVQGPKLAGLTALVARLRRQGAPIDGVGIQSHLTTASDLSDLPRILADLGDQGLDVAITEADVRMRLAARTPVPGETDKQATVFAELVDACRTAQACRSFTFWGFTDRFSWTGTPAFGQGRATPLNADLTPKPALAAIVRTLRS